MPNSSKVRVHEISKELGISNKEVIEKAKSIGIEVKAAQSGMSEEDAGRLYDFITHGGITQDDSITKTTPATPKEEVEKKPSPKKSTQTKENKDVSTSKEDIKKQQVKDKNPPKAKENVAISHQKPPKDDNNKQGEQASVRIKKKGLVIVKKRKPIIEEVAKKVSKSGYGSLNESTLEEISSKSSKNKKIAQAQTKRREVGDKLNIFEERDLSTSTSSFEDDQVVMIDMSMSTINADKKEDDRQSLNKAKLTNKKSLHSFSQNRTLGRFKKKKKSKKIPQNSGYSVSSIEIPENIRVYEFANRINKTTSEVIKALFDLGTMSTKNDFLDKDSLEILADEFSIDIKTVDITDEFDYVKEYDSKYMDKKHSRAPIVTIMGHVDHGKTSLLDKIRDSKIASSEAGGITQSIGAYSVNHNANMITFIDTPGHSAFSSMRARGATLTDIAVIVVAADDGVKPQTKEALNHAKEAKVPVIIAINKMDKEGANPDLVKSSLSELGYTPVDWGGEHEFIPISALNGDGIDNLLETILIQAEILELKANPNAEGRATVIESSHSKGRGPVASIIVNNGKLNIGDTIVCGSTYGRIKAILDDKSRPLKEVLPSQTAVIVGLNKIPQSGDVVIEVQSDKKAKELADKRAIYERGKEFSLSTKTTLEDLTSKIIEGNLKNLKVVLKADDYGSLEATKDALLEIRNDEIKISVVHFGVGGITENDVALASSTDDCIIVGFNVRPTGNVKSSAKKYGVDIKTYSIIYEMIEELTAIVSGMMDAVITEENTGQAEVRQTFSTPKGQVAGCYVSDGSVIRGGKARIIRDGIILQTTTIKSLRRFEDDVKEVNKSYECGIILDNFDDIRVGDYIETFIEKEEVQTL